MPAVAEISAQMIQAGWKSAAVIVSCPRRRTVASTKLLNETTTTEDKKEWQHVRQELVELESLPAAGAVAER